MTSIVKVGRNAWRRVHADDAGPLLDVAVSPFCRVGGAGAAVLAGLLARYIGRARR